MWQPCHPFALTRIDKPLNGNHLPRGTTLAEGRAVMKHEQREFSRAPLTGMVRFFEWNKAQHAEAIEISAGGIFLKTTRALSEGTMLTLRVTLPGIKHAFTVLGKVVRTVKGGLLSEAGMGIRFLDLMPGDRAVINDYVSHRMLRQAA
jgi:uncharacterized protein (TIGR02266 family)